MLFSDGKHQAAKEPSRSNILASIHSMCQQATGEDSILFFFAGHGTRDSKDSYLLTQEYRASIVSETSIPMNLVNEYFSQSKSRFKMRFFDACHAGRMGRRSLPLQGPDIKSHFLVDAEGWATLSACKEDQYAHEREDLGHGIFSYFLIKGLSGAAATSKQEVTLDSLKVYVIEQTIELTKQLGIQQIPVSDGLQSGKLVMANSPHISKIEITNALVQIRDINIEQIKPTSNKIPEFVANIRSFLESEMEGQDYVAQSQEAKMIFGEDLVQKIYGYCHDQNILHLEHLKDLATITVERKSIRSCPLNLLLAEYLQESKIANALEWELKYKTEHVYTSLPLSFLTPNTREVMDGIGERRNYYDSAVEIKIGSRKKLSPIFSMVMAIIPATFGLYLLQYSCSTKLGREQKEYWDDSTFLVRVLHAIPINNEGESQIMVELEDMYAQLISFFLESCQVRGVYLRNIGISGESLI